MRKRWGWGLGLALLVPTGGHATEVPPALRSWLLAYDSVPSAAQVRQAGGTAASGLLDRVVLDTRETGYARQRALAFLGTLDEAKATALLRKHLHSTEPGLRRTGALAWAMGPARRGDTDSLPPLATLLADPEPSVRTAAARGLEFVHNRETALAKAKQRRQIEKHPEVKASLDHAVQTLSAGR